MSRKIYIITLLLFTAITFGGISYAGSGSGGMGAGSGSGGMGGDHGMLGGQSHGMMGSGQNYSNSWREQPRTNQNYQYEKKESERMREEIKAKRQELSALYRAEKPNKEMIDQKIAELDKLEAKLDEKLSDDK
jgi:Spy/CpxP family protein refolding chaperone